MYYLLVTVYKMGKSKREEQVASGVDGDDSKRQKLNTSGFSVQDRVSPLEPGVVFTGER